MSAHIEGRLLENHLKQLRLPTFAQNYRQFAEDAARANQGYDAFLFALAEQEITHRDTNRQRHFIKTAHFPLLKELADFDFSCVPSLNQAQVLTLSLGEYIGKAEPILMVGNPGLGKTHVAIGLAMAACRQGHRVRFYTAASLVNDLIQAQDEHHLPRLFATALKQKLIVLDEFGFIPFSAVGAQLLFQFCSALHERVALIVTTNLKFADWTQVLGDERLTAALLDRLTHRAHILEFTGESFRFRQRLQREAAARKP